MRRRRPAAQPSPPQDRLAFVDDPDRQYSPAVGSQAKISFTSAGDQRGDVSPPALVRKLGGEPQARAPGPVGQLGSDQAVPGQVTADGGGRNPDLVVLQMPDDAVRPGIRALPGQALHKATTKPAASATIVFVEVPAAGTRNVSRHGERLWSAH